MATHRLYSVLDAIINKITTYSTIAYKLCDRFYYTQDVTRTSTTVPSGFSLNNSRHIAIGGRVYFLADTTKSSAWSTGNITNTTMLTVGINLNLQYGSLADSGFEIYGLSGSKGGLKKIRMTRTETTNKTFIVDSVDTADTAAIFSDCTVVKYNNLL